jgi:hypothetical protein
MQTAQRIVIKGPGKAPTAAGVPAARVPLPILLRVPRFPAEVGGATAAAPVSVLTDVSHAELSPHVSERSSSAPKRGWLFRILAGVTVLAVVLTPTLVINWEAWGVGSWSAQIRASWEQAEGPEPAEVIPAREPETPPAEPVAPNDAPPPAAALAPYIIPIENGGNSP